MARRTSFYYAFLALPPARRRAIITVFDFCRAVDDGVDLASDPAEADRAVSVWRREVELVFTGGHPATAEGRALQESAAAFPLGRADFDALVDGVAMDARPRRYETFAELEAYCHRVASAVGLMCIEIFGYRDPAVREYARDLGVALQLTNILRDVAADFAQGRVYIPQEDFRRFLCGEDDLRRAVAERGAGARSEPLRALLDHQIARARIFFSRAARLLPSDERQGLVAAEIMRAIYWDLLQRIEAADGDVFSRVIRASRPAKARIALVTWWRVRRTGR